MVKQVKRAVVLTTNQMLLDGQLIWFSFLILIFSHSVTVYLHVEPHWQGTSMGLWSCCFGWKNAAVLLNVPGSQWSSGQALMLGFCMLIGGSVEGLSPFIAFCMPLNVIALWAQSHHGFCKCSRETHGFLDSQAHLKWGWEKMGGNKYISALIKSSLDCVVWVLWTCPPLTGCMKGMKSLVVKIGVAVLQEKAVWFPGVL